MKSKNTRYNLLIEYRHDKRKVIRKLIKKPSKRFNIVVFINKSTDEWMLYKEHPQKTKMYGYQSDDRFELVNSGQSIKELELNHPIEFALIFS